GLGIAAQAREAAVQHRVVLGGDAVRVVDAAEAQRDGVTGRLGHGVFQQPVERQRRGAGADGFQERTAAGAAFLHWALRCSNRGLRTYATSTSMNLPWPSAGICFHMST